MSRWLLKTEPDSYSWEDLVRDKQATWDGVTNPVALKHIRTMKKGDLVLVYHTGKQRAVIGVAQVSRDPFADPKQKDERLVVVEIKPKDKLARPVTLEQIKADKTFADWELVRISRLSVMPVPQKIWERIEELSSQ